MFNEKIDSKARLIIVNNNESISNAGYESYDWIEGNNTNWDFSGWSSGLANIEELKDCDSVIFSNDTFCHHNRWGSLKYYHHH